MAFPAPRVQDSYQYKIQNAFDGYNHQRSAGDGEWYDMQNLTSADAPLLSSRNPRYLVTTLTAPNGICAGDDLAYFDGGTLHYGNKTLSGFSDSAKTLCFMGDRLIVFPDKKLVKTNLSPMVAENLGNVNTVPARECIFCDGTYTGEPATANTIKRANGTFSGFSKGDAVTISGCTVHPENNLTIIIREISEDLKELRFYENSFVLGEGQTSYTETSAITIERTVPDMDGIFVHENRLWGYKGNTIFASAAGDPKNFNNFDATGLEAWQVDVLESGKFTGACSFIGMPVFFKDNHVYKIFGDMPSEFNFVPSADLGVDVGSDSSLAIACETLFYLSRAGVVAYSGGLPSPISIPFGDEKYKNGIAGTDGLNYYISMEDSAGRWNLFVYDALRGMWHKEDGSHAVGFAYYDHGLYMLCADGKLWFIGSAADAPSDSTAEQNVTWYAESADFTSARSGSTNYRYGSVPYRKWLDGVCIRAELAHGATLTVKVRYNNETAWNTLATCTIEGKGSLIAPNIPRRADFYRIRLEGTGKVWIYQIAPNVEAGSEWHNER